jgi:hypothetical protein
MRLRIKWFNIEVAFSGNDSTIKEKNHAKGKYCKRNDIEPFIRRLESEFKAQIEGLKHIKNDFNSIQHLIKEHGDRSDIEHLTAINRKLNKLITQNKNKSKQRNTERFQLDDTETLMEI